MLGGGNEGHPRYLIKPKAFREAGEASAVFDGMDQGTTSRRAGHSIEVQNLNIVKFDPIEGAFGLIRETTGKQFDVSIEIKIMTFYFLIAFYILLTFFYPSN